jgi:CRISPR-associated protein Csm3
MKLVKLHTIKGTIILESGLHIGAGDTEMHIGGTDNPVITHPHTREPYIPGSSIKGKVRSLLEMRSGLMGKTEGSVLALKHLKGLGGDEREEAMSILRLFGISGADSDEAGEVGPTRVSFADCNLAEESREKANMAGWPLLEVKAENSINRIKGTALNPRFTERVVAGLHFDFMVSLKEMEGDGDLKTTLLQGLKLLELDALGGSGSRGYGRIRLVFDDDKLNTTFADISPLG